MNQLFEMKRDGRLGLVQIGPDARIYNLDTDVYVNGERGLVRAASDLKAKIKSRVGEKDLYSFNEIASGSKAFEAQDEEEDLFGVVLTIR